MSRQPGRTTVARGLAAFALAAACGPLAAQGSERDELERVRRALDEVVRALADRGALTAADADRLLKLTAPRAAPDADVVRRPAAAASPTVGAAPPGSGSGDPIRIPYVPESVKRDIREQIKAEVVAQARAERWGDPGALPEWLDWLRFDGDIRIRAQADRYAAGNAPAAILYDDSFAGGAIGTNYADLTNTSVDRNRLRVRARLGVTPRLGEQWTGGLRISTGSSVGPVSTSSTAGDASDRYGIKMDRAFVRWHPTEWISVSAGRAQSPFFATEAIFAPDLGFDGVSASVAPRIGVAWQLVVTAGWFALRENALSKDRTLGAAQLAAEWRPSPRLGARLAYGRYRYANEEGVADTSNFGTPSYALTEYERGFRQKGNTLFRINNALLDTGAARWGLASQFDVEQIHAAVDLAHFDPLTISIASDLFRNRGFDGNEIASRTGFSVARATRGYLHRITVGSAAVRTRGDWQVSLSYRKVEKDATLDAFTDPDFMLGGTNVRGHALGLTYGVARNVSVGLRLLSGREVEGPPLSLDVIQLDLGVRF